MIFNQKNEQKSAEIPNVILAGKFWWRHDLVFSFLFNDVDDLAFHLVLSLLKFSQSRSIYTSDKNNAITHFNAIQNLNFSGKKIYTKFQKLYKMDKYNKTYQNLFFK